MANSASASPTSLPQISLRLDRNNYSFWRFQILATIRAHGYDDLLSPILIPPPQTISTPNHDRRLNPEFQLWFRRDQFLLSWIIGSISESMIGHVTRCTSSRDLWLTLKSLFQSQSKARVMQLKLQLQTQKKGDLTIDKYFLTMCGIADNLAAIGKPIADEDLILHILSGFGSEFDAVVVNLTNRSEPLSLPDVQFALQAHENRLLNHCSSFSPIANLATHQNQSTDFTYNRGRPPTYHRGSTSRGRGGRHFGKDSKIVCQLCGKSGHVAFKCFKRFDIHFAGPAPPQAFYSDLHQDVSRPSHSQGADEGNSLQGTLPA
ncbi:hypothetical protein C2S51_005106 [Perilla frutescens var. frutescens]|nr:hypothetical protein C2S51_005106 [Perilla frutescens var. frutescens]